MNTRVEVGDKGGAGEPKRWGGITRQLVMRGEKIGSLTHDSGACRWCLTFKMAALDDNKDISGKMRKRRFSKPSSASSRPEECAHPTVMKDMCAECGADLREKYGLAGDRAAPTVASVAMVHSIPELMVSEEEAQNLGHEDEARLLRTRKLALVVDLDQTVIHTTNEDVPPNMKDVHHFQLWNQGTWYHTRVRPGAVEFLQRISKLYELHICTFGARLYAHTVARILDPEDKLFHHRILSRDECFDPCSKTASIRGVFPCGDAMVCIIDDREDVWGYAPNLIHVKPYHFFKGTGDINWLPFLQQRFDNGEVKQAEQEQEEGQEVPCENAQGIVEENGAGNVAAVDLAAASENPPQDSASITTAKSTSEAPTKQPAAEDSAVKNGSAEVTPADEMQEEVHEREEEGEHGTADDANFASTTEDKECASKVEPSEGANEDAPVNEHKMESGVETPLKPSEKKEISDSVAAVGEECSETSENVIEERKVTEAKNEDCVRLETGTENGNTVDIELCQSSKISEKEIDDNLCVQQPTAETEKEKLEKKKEDEKDLSASEDAPPVKCIIESPEKSGTGEIIIPEDSDDYLFYLEDILGTLHKAFYDMYDQLIKEGKKEHAPKVIPDMKNIVPYVKRKTLKDCSIVFSGLIPTNLAPERSRAYNVARALGANIQTDVTPKGKEAPEKGGAMTHVVAAQLGTRKVTVAQKCKGVHVVNVDWLWSCNERWEKVDERLFPLNSGKKSQPGRGSPLLTRKPEGSGGGEAKTGSKQAPPAASHFDYNPLLTLSSEDLAQMDKEVSDATDEEAEEGELSDDDDDDDDGVARVADVLRDDLDASSSSEESLTAEYPRGWKRKRDDDDDDDSAGDYGDVLQMTQGEDDTNDGQYDGGSKRLRQEESESGEEGEVESIGSVDEEMAAAVEKEFLS
ncbi:PREDICTED: RNA polymerase II subunit A C-terminal domain phosphatase-like [Priapulus caudatus]|uniref:RNA polymerase II subunit A C-terminal domain phosphatase n=1 Tax=Priapulus caudatus TaxID=37621 RepID=A0ABM1E4U1_PRICU|nr:PREDICTED: RNA polymerase II subunit A C-terminal domain phosphatase-like [Priapulus caudatus]